MKRKDIDFLHRADRILENYNRRIETLKTEIFEDTERAEIREYLYFGTPRKVLESLNKVDRYNALIVERDAHQARYHALRDQQRKERAINRLCADANRLAGTDGFNFFTKVGKVFKEGTDE